jgi:hypothetical protein
MEGDHDQPLTWIGVFVCVHVARSVLTIYRTITDVTLPLPWTSGILIAASLILSVLSTCASTDSCGYIDTMRCHVLSSQYSTGPDSDCPQRMLPPTSVAGFLSNLYDTVNITLMSTELWMSSCMPSFAKLRVDAV